MTWEGELYLEAHNGTYTSMAEIKHYNRTMEELLRMAEILNTVAILNGHETFEQSVFTDLWRIFMIDQFHDVLPGTCTLLTL